MRLLITFFTFMLVGYNNLLAEDCLKKNTEEEAMNCLYGLTVQENGQKQSSQSSIDRISTKILSEATEKQITDPAIKYHVAA